MTIRNEVRKKPVSIDRRDVPQKVEEKKPQLRRVDDNVTTRSQSVDKNLKPTEQTQADALEKQKSDLNANYTQNKLATKDEPSALDAVTKGDKTLQQGSVGEDVREAQKLLNSKGAQPPLVEDGKYGPATHKAVEAFKQKNAITDEAGIGAQTVEGLKNAPTVPQVELPKNALRPGQSGPEVEKLQRDLNATGFTVNSTGRYDAETEAAVKRLQTEKGLTPTGVADPKTRQALASIAPPDGQTVERKPDYDKMYADGRVDTTMAIGFDEGGYHDTAIQDTVNGLKNQGYRPVSHDEIKAMSPEQRQKLGLTEDRYDPNVDYFHKTFKDPKTGQDVDAVVRVITPYTGDKPEDAKASFEKALKQDELITYNGHGRYGTGPDFDSKESGRGNVVINPKGSGKVPDALADSLRGRKNEMPTDGESPAYQVLMFSSCNSEKYVDELRKKRSTGTTDALVTSRETAWGTGSPQTLRLLEGATNRDSYNRMVRDMNEIEAQPLRNGNDKNADRVSRDTYYENGTLDNPGNQRVEG